MKNFKLALKSNKFGIKHSNFGMRPNPRIKNAQLDSIIFLSENTAVMVTSTYCKWREQDKKTTFWKAGRDTLRNHALFNKKHSVKHIKKVLKKKYHFKNSIKDVKFIDYSGKFEKKGEDKEEKRNTVAPLQISQPTQPPHNPFLLVMISIIAAIALLTGAIAWNLRKAGVLSHKSTT